MISLRIVAVAFAVLIGQTYSVETAIAADSSRALIGAEKPISRSFFGLHVHRPGDQVRWPDPAIGSYRTWDAKVRWADLQPASDRWDFGRLDAIVDTMRLANVDVLLPLGMPPLWASSRPSETSAYQVGEAAVPRDMGDWSTYVRTVGQRYKGKVLAYEIWNEPNLPKFFSGSPRDAVDLTCSARKILKSIDSRNIVVSPAPLGDYGVEWLKRFLSAGGGSCVDVIGYHLYNRHRDPESHIEIVANVREVMGSFKVGGLPLWNTESGWLIASADRSIDATVAGFTQGSRTLSQHEAAAFVARTIALHAVLGLGRTYWYALDNEAMGLQEKSGQPKKALIALTQLARYLTGKRIAKCEENGARWQCAVESDGKAVGSLLWTTGSQAVRPEVDLQTYARAEILGQLGEVSIMQGRDAVDGGAAVIFHSSR